MVGRDLMILVGLRGGLGIWMHVVFFTEIGFHR